MIEDLRDISPKKYLINPELNEDLNRISLDFIS